MNSRSLLIASCLICVAAGIKAGKNAAKSKKMPKSSSASTRPSSKQPTFMLRHALQVSKYRRCKTQHDCPKDECCALWKRKDVKVCKKLRLSAQRCSPFEIPGLSSVCPCTPGLTCALTALVHQGTRPIYQCTEIPANQLEREFEEL